jgi:hypothetical protein
MIISMRFIFRVLFIDGSNVLSVQGYLRCQDAGNTIVQDMSIVGLVNSVALRMDNIPLDALLDR